MNDDMIRIKMGLRGENDSRVISLRLSVTMLEKIDEIAKKAHRSRNEVIRKMLEYGIDNTLIEEVDKTNPPEPSPDDAVPDK